MLLAVERAAGGIVMDIKGPLIVAAVACMVIPAGPASAQVKPSATDTGKGAVAPPTVSDEAAGNVVARGTGVSGGRNPTGGTFVELGQPFVEWKGEQKSKTTGSSSSTGRPKVAAPKPNIRDAFEQYQ
jgi:hypothetical protein